MNSVTSTQRRDGACIEDSDAAPNPSDLGRRLRAQAHLDAAAVSELIKTLDDTNGGGAIDGATSRPTALYVDQIGDANTIDPADVVQKGPDCALMASLAALASTAAGRNLLQGAIVENRDAGGKVASYTVTLHKPEVHLLRPATFAEVRVTVDARFRGDFAQLRDGEQEGELWPRVVESAYAQLVGGYERLATETLPANTMEALTGKPATDIRLDAPPGYAAKRLEADLAAGKLVVAASKACAVPGDNPFRITPGHAYQVTATETTGGRLWVALRDTKEGAPQPHVPFDQLATWFRAVTVGQVR